MIPRMLWMLCLLGCCFPSPPASAASTDASSLRYADQTVEHAPMRGNLYLDDVLLPSHRRPPALLGEEDVLNALEFDVGGGISVSLTHWREFHRWLRRHADGFDWQAPPLFQAAFDLNAAIEPLASFSLPGSSPWRVLAAFVALEGQDMEQAPPNVAYVVASHGEHLMLLRWPLAADSLPPRQCRPMPFSGDPWEAGVIGAWLACLRREIPEHPALPILATRIRALLRALRWRSDEGMRR